MHLAPVDTGKRDKDGRPITQWEVLPGERLFLHELVHHQRRIRNVGPESGKGTVEEYPDPDGEVVRAHNEDNEERKTIGIAEADMTTDLYGEQRRHDSENNVWPGAKRVTHVGEYVRASD